MTDKAAPKSDDSVETHATTTPLTTPCTLLQLKNWLDRIGWLSPGINAGTVTSTATQISASWP